MEADFSCAIAVHWRGDRHLVRFDRPPSLQGGGRARPSHLGCPYSLAFKCVVAWTRPDDDAASDSSDRNPLSPWGRCLPRGRRRAYDRENDKLGGKRMCRLPRTLALCLWSVPYSILKILLSIRKVLLETPLENPRGRTVLGVAALLVLAALPPLTAIAAR